MALSIASARAFGDGCHLGGNQGNYVVSIVMHVVVNGNTRPLPNEVMVGT